MIIFTKKFKLFFNDIIIDEESCSFKYKNKIINYDNFYNFILESENSDELFKLINGKEYNKTNLDEYFNIINENFSYLELSNNILFRKMIAEKIVYIFLHDNWLREHDYIKMKLESLKNKDIIYYYICIIVYKLNNIMKKINDKNYKKLFILESSFYDFIYDYYD